MSTSTQKKQTSQLVSGADILVQSLINHDVDTIFAYPGGASMPLHQALTRQEKYIRTILPRHEQGGGFAAQGYARATGRVGVCMATSGPGATNLVTAIADAKLDSIPIVAICGQVPTHMIGNDAFQETPIVEVCRGITKHHCLVTNVKDITRVVREAFLIASTGRPGPVLIDLPKNIQLATTVPDYNAEIDLPGYSIEDRKALPEQIKQIAAAIRMAKRPVIYAGGGIITSGAYKALRKLVELTDIPVTMTLMGLGSLSADDPHCMDMLGMHGSVYANNAISEADLMLALGVRFDDRVTGKIEAFCEHGKIVHVDIDPSELNKNKPAHIPVVSDLRYVLEELNKIVEPPENMTGWLETCQRWKKEEPYKYDKNAPYITQQFAIETLHRLTHKLDPVVAVGVGQHQMWAAQYYKFNKPRTFLSSSGLGTMGFGLPAAMGAQAANPSRLCIDIDGDGSFLMNIQELACCRCENLPVKVVLLNNQHLGMVMQWEDRFMDGNRGHTYLGPIGNPETKGRGDGFSPKERYPDFVGIAQGFGCGGASVQKKEDLAAAIETMIAYDGPYVLDVQVPYQQHVLPMIPSNGTVADIIKE